MKHICICITDNYTDYCRVLISSILHYEDKVAFHILYKNLLPYNLAKLKDSVPETSSIFMYSIVSSDFDGLPVSRQWPEIIYYRLLLPRLINESVDRILYLDCDILVRGKLDELWEMDLGEVSLAAVHDKHSPLAPISNTVGANYNKGYFNSGVLLINLGYWRKNNCTDKILAYMRDNVEILEHPDQDGLNHCLADSWAAVPPKWNFITHYQNLYYNKDHLEADLNKSQPNYPVIVHFTEGKPWQLNCRTLFKREYFEEMKRIGLGSKIPKPGIKQYLEFYFLKLLQHLGIRRMWVNYEL